jgi:predicted MPP superfamily phosphohydrolase
MSLKFVEEQVQVLRLRSPHKTRQTSLRMTSYHDANLNAMRKYFLIAAALAVLGLVVDAFFIEPYRIEVTHHSLLAAIAAPLKIALLADVHTRAFGLRERKLVELLDAEKPDVIVICGDTIGRDNDYGDVTEFLKHLHAPLGVWLVRGNWENHELPRNEHALYASAGAHLLLNEARPIRPDVWLLGLDDSSSGYPRPDPALESVPPEAYIIALFHAPGYFDNIAGKVPLALAGHTHGGQFRIPFVPVFWLPKGSAGFLEGWYAQHGSHLYVTRGIGTSIIWARFLCRPELTILTLEPNADSHAPGASQISIGLPQVSPFNVSMQAGNSQQFSATVPCTGVPAGGVCPQSVTWKATNGAIDSRGTFQAPSTAGPVTVTATSSADPSKSGDASVTVVSPLPVTQSCRARNANVASLSCTLPCLQAGHTLVAILRVHGLVHASIGAFSDSVNGQWPPANARSTSFNSEIGSLAGGMAFVSNTRSSASPVTIMVQVSGGGGGDELAVWDFAGNYSPDGSVPAPIAGTTGATPALAAVKAGDLVFAWSASFGRFQENLQRAPFTDIGLEGSSNVDAAAQIQLAPQINVADTFAVEGNSSVSGIIAFSSK